MKLLLSLFLQIPILQTEKSIFQLQAQLPHHLTVEVLFLPPVLICLAHYPMVQIQVNLADPLGHQVV